MENASKALIMAGGILFSIIIISLLVLFSGNIRKLKQEEQESKATLQAAEFNKQFTSYERKIYGSELFSIANKVENYNQKFSSSYSTGKKNGIGKVAGLYGGEYEEYAEDYTISTGYHKIDFTITLKKDLDELSNFFNKDDKFTATQFISKMQEIQKEIDKYAIKKITFKTEKNNPVEVSFKKLATSRKADIINEKNDDRIVDYDTKINNSEYEYYKNIKNLVSEIKQKTFEYVEPENKDKYDSNGRIILIQYEYN